MVVQLHAIRTVISHQEPGIQPGSPETTFPVWLYFILRDQSRSPFKTTNRSRTGCYVSSSGTSLHGGVPLLEGLTFCILGWYPGIDGGGGCCRAGMAQEVVLFTIASSCQPVLIGRCCK